MIHRHRLRLWLLLPLSLILALLGRLPLSAQGMHHAALVVDFGDGRVVARVVAFAEDSLSGVELLERSGLQVALLGGWGGTALCAVEGVGCPPTPQDCFCQCRGGTCRYWSYFHLQEGAWVYAQSGAAERQLRDGDVDGWVWGDGRTPPPLLIWEEILALSAAGGPVPSPSAAPAISPVLPTASVFPSPAVLTATAGPAAMEATRVPSISSPGISLLPSPCPTAPQETPARYPAPTEGRAPSPASDSAGGPAAHPEAGAAGTFPYGALAFAALFLVLACLGLWARRRR